MTEQDDIRDLHDALADACEELVKADERREALEADVAQLRAVQARHIDEWHEDHGDVLWWHPDEPPWVGSPLCLGQTVEMRHCIGGKGEIKTVRTDVGGWPGYHEWWTPLPAYPVIPVAPAALADAEQEAGS